MSASALFASALDGLNGLPSFVSGLIWASLGGGLCALVVWLFCRMLPRLSPGARTWLWWLVCAKFVLGLWSPVPPLTVPIPPVSSTPRNDSPTPIQSQQSEPQKTVRSSVQTSHTVLPLFPQTAPVLIPDQSVRRATFSWAAALFLLWIAGLLVRLAVAVWQYATIATLIRHAHPANNPEDANLLGQCCRALGLRTAPKLLQTMVTVEPFVAGIRRPVIMLTDAHRAALTPQELASVVAHELAHLKRGDLWLGLVPLLAQTVFWFFPPVWWAVREYEMAREGAADTLTLRVTQTPPAVYGRLLVKLSAENGLSSPIAALSVSAPFRSVERRLRMLEKYPLYRRPARVVLCFTGCIALLGLVPWRLVASAPEPAKGKLPPSSGGANLSAMAKARAPHPQNLDFANGLDGWTHVQTEGNKQGFSPASAFSASIVPGVSAPVPGSVVQVAAINAKTQTLSILGQNIAGSAFAGKRIRFAAWLKTEKAYGAGLWIRLDAEDFQQNWYFNRPNTTLTGTKPWKRYELVFDVPDGARGFAFGIEQAGAGTVWATGVTVEVVGNNIPVTPAPWDSRETDTGDVRWLPARNLNFMNGLVGWGHSADGGDGPQNQYYEVGVDSAERYDKVPSGFVRAKQAKPIGNGLLRQDINALPYRNKRVRFRANVKGVGGSGYLSPFLAILGDSGIQYWMLTDAALQAKSGEWKTYSFVADVPDGAVVLMVGLNLKGVGKGYLNNVVLETVDKSVPVSPGAQTKQIPQQKSESANTAPDPPTQPRNLDFAKGLTGWEKMNPEGDAPDYQIGIASTGGRDGKPAAFLKAVSSAPHSYGVLAQYFVPSELRGKRVRMSAWLRTDNAQNAGMWLRVDTKRMGYGGAGFNFSDHPLRGTLDWKRYEYVLDIPDQSVGIQFGLDLTGTGAVYTDGFTFEVVDKSTPLTPGE